MSSLTYTFPLLVLARLLLAYVGNTISLHHDHLLSSPLTSFSRLQEGLFLLKNGINPYSGGAFRQSPLYLSLFSTILTPSPKIAPILWLFCDSIAAWALVSIWRSRQSVRSSTRDTMVAASYLFNPYLTLPSLALSTSSFDNCLTLLAIMFASHGSSSFALLSLALLVHLSLSSALIVAPVFMILASSSGSMSRLASPQAFQPHSSRKLFPLVLELVGYFLGLSLASLVVSGGFEWISQTWGASLTLPDLTPNCGLWWYFFTEMFDHFRPFFLMAFSIHLVMYIAPLCIKFQYDPLYATFVLIGVLGTFKAYPTLSDSGLFITMITIFPEIYPYLRHPIVTVLLHLHAALLMPLFHHLWLDQGTGNANFFYASTLVFACANSAAVMDVIWAGLRLAIGDVEKEQEGERSIIQE